ncbi:glycosyltransferase [Rhodoplanes sp. TEM]|uniref:Glycosyltransferase n=1 Tax=Rhodoplanes tepidamans TaxID=200616 RepID=A0ABT5J6I1_RHOTP|nr:MULTISPECIES: glycosyltransferase [Rhodoplanes]MDC7785234.1 glycosyltransferase [Rhodoplanes tepidamans]MDC7986414.1 glycosyltransferase [Rhodoplanes sp. TEM]MDQ0353492.1 glycosyltransferase involved in cell wall biosynthesis [Rhodoplanes tepidamans]
MKILFASGTPHLPQVLGGLETNTHEMAGELIRRGHDVAVLAKLSCRDVDGATRALTSRLCGRSFVADDALGYRVYRARAPARAIADIDRPDVAVIQNGHPLAMIEALARRDVPIVVYHHGLGFERWTEVDPRCDPRVLPVARYVSNSRFTARRFEARYGLASDVIPPVFRASRYRTERRSTFVTFINPVPEKGVDLALAVVDRLPAVRFCFVKGWPLSVRAEIALRRAVARRPNLTLRGRSDPKAIFADTRLLMVPSQWEAETWGRVVSEAQFSGIPVVATDRGGLPESVGPGGTIFAMDADVARWSAEVDRLWHDHTYYAEKSAAALAHAARPELDIERQLSRFEAILEDCRPAVSRDTGPGGQHQAESLRRPLAAGLVSAR